MNSVTGIATLWFKDSDAVMTIECGSLRGQPKLHHVEAALAGCKLTHSWSGTYRWPTRHTNMDDAINDAIHRMHRAGWK